MIFIEIKPPNQLILWLFPGAVWCNYGAIGVERMDFVLLVDCSWSTPSRGWTEFNPMERMFNPPVQFEVRRSIVFCRIYRS